MIARGTQYYRSTTHHADAPERSSQGSPGLFQSVEDFDNKTWKDGTIGVSLLLTCMSCMTQPGIPFFSLLQPPHLLFLTVRQCDWGKQQQLYRSGLKKKGAKGSKREGVSELVRRGCAAWTSIGRRPCHACSRREAKCILLWLFCRSPWFFECFALRRIIQRSVAESRGRGKKKKPDGFVAILCYAYPPLPFS